MSHKDYCHAGCADPPTRVELELAHGKPEEFEGAVWNAIGEISVQEALAAIRYYHNDYLAASIRENMDRRYASSAGEKPGTPENKEQS